VSFVLGGEHLYDRDLGLLSGSREGVLDVEQVSCLAQWGFLDVARSVMSLVLGREHLYERDLGMLSGPFEGVLYVA